MFDRIYSSYVQNNDCLLIVVIKRQSTFLYDVFLFPPQIFPTRYLRCPSAVTVNVLKKFLAMKFAIPNTHQVNK